MGIRLEGFSEADRFLAGLPRRARSILSQTLNDGAKHAATEATRRVRETWNIKIRAAKAQLPITRSNAETLRATIRVKGGPIALMAFGPKQTRRGISIKVRRGKQTVLRHAFLATMQSGHTGVFYRRGPKVQPRRGRYAGRIIKRGPRSGQPLLRQRIYERYVVSMPTMVRGLWPEIEADARAYLNLRLHQQIARALEGK